jgi:hypothetical protein
MKFFYSLLLSTLLTAVIQAQSVSTRIGARAQGMGNCASGLFDVWGVFNNMAGIAQLNQPIASFSYDVRSALPGANRAAAVLGVPIKTSVIGGGVFRFGDDLYSESILTAGYGNQLGLAALGAQVNYIQYRAEGFGSKGVVSFNFGGIAEITPQLSVGAHITNINQPRINTDNERLPSLLTAGLVFKPTDKVLIATELEKDLDYKATWKLGAEYVFHTKFTARTGFNVYPRASFFGLGFKTNRFVIDYALQHSTLLNFGHQATVSYQFEKK